MTGESVLEADITEEHATWRVATGNCTAGQGECVEGQCVCYDGWSGQHCDEYTCKNECFFALGHGKCDR